MNFLDKITIAGTRKRVSDGALIVDARCARTGIQLYAGHEVGRPDLSIVRVFRPADEVFSSDTLESFAHRPITNDHPPVPVTAENWKDYAVGHTTDEVLGEQRYIRVPLMVSDATAIKDIEDGKRELSPGYTCDLDWTAGKTQNGEDYDAVQRKIRANHVAIVKKGRSGSEVRIGDSWGAVPVNDGEPEGPKLMTTKTINFDGMPILATDQAESAINILQGKITKLTADAAAATTSHTAAIAAKDTEIGTLTAKLADAEKKIPSGAALDAMVADRVAVIGHASKIIKDFKPDGLDNAAIRKAVVTARLGDAAVKDRSPEAIAAMFDVVTADGAGGQVQDQFRQTFIAGGNNNQQVQDHGRSSYIDYLNSAHKGHKAA